VSIRAELQGCYRDLDELAGLLADGAAPALLVIAGENLAQDAIRLLRELTDPEVVRIQRRRT
jgi:hypothetical protein